MELPFIICHKMLQYENEDKKPRLKIKLQDKYSRQSLCTISALYLQHQQQQKTVTLRSHTNLFHLSGILFVGVFLSTWCDWTTDSFCDKFCHYRGSCFDHFYQTWSHNMSSKKSQINNIPDFNISVSNKIHNSISWPILCLPSNWKFPPQEVWL